MNKQKFDIEQQLDHMASKGIQFNVISKDEARLFLSQSTYYFKLKAFAKNYDKYTSEAMLGKYVNLEFAYLKELSILDMHFRKILSSMTVDIEHYLKVKFIKDISMNPLEDGYNIVEMFFKQNEEICRNIAAKCTYSVTSDLVKKYCNNWAAWNIIEVLSFGSFVKLYDLYYTYYKPLYIGQETYISLLGSVRFLRNAAAHNNCLLNSIYKPYVNSKCPKNYCSIDGVFTAPRNRVFRKTKELSNIITNSQAEIGIASNTRKKMLENPVIHDLTAVIYLYSLICSSGSIKAIKKSLGIFFARCSLHSDYFKTNQSIQSAYNYFQKIVDFYLHKDDTISVEQKE